MSRAEYVDSGVAKARFIYISIHIYVCVFVCVLRLNTRGQNKPTLRFFINFL